MKIIDFVDVVSEKMQEDKAFKDKKASYHDHLKYMINGVLSNKNGPKFFMVEGRLCQNHIIKVVINRFEADTEHYVNALEDNWISKEFMSVVFDQNLANEEPFDKAKAGGKGSVPHADFKKSAKNGEVQGLDLNSMFDELSKLLTDDTGQGDDGWDNMKNTIQHENGERDDKLSNEKMY